MNEKSTHKYIHCARDGRTNDRVSPASGSRPLASAGPETPNRFRMECQAILQVRLACHSGTETYCLLSEYSLRAHRGSLSDHWVKRGTLRRLFDP
jgi:hypothetical protein